MKNVLSKLQKYLKTLSKTKVVFLLFGFGSLIWFLIRVIPKPSRASYPCQRAAFPIASSFIIYVTGMLTSVFAFKKMKQTIVARKYLLAGLFALFLMVSLAFVFYGDTEKSLANGQSIKVEMPITPIGVAKGIFPGRVSWVWNPNTTNENCKNALGSGDYWWMDANNNQTAINATMRKTILQLTGTTKLATAWDSLFKYYNRTHGKGNVGYVVGQKIAIKINITNTCCGNVDDNYDLIDGVDNNGDAIGNPHWTDASPHAVMSLLSELIDSAKVAQADIYIGDPFKQFINIYFDKIKAKYPSVNCFDAWGVQGRYLVKTSAAGALKFSGKFNNTTISAMIPQLYVDATYMINFSQLKVHDEGGVTICGKNHQGSWVADGTSAFGLKGASAWDSHPSLPANSPGYGKYRHIVDFMGHKDMGGKTILYLVDGLWSANGPQAPPVKFIGTPFNNDWPSSFIASQDAVAIESVCMDIELMGLWDLPAERYSNKTNFAAMSGADDYMHQAADPANWPVGITYKPSGTTLTSLGVHEHWNNDVDKQYTRNLDPIAGTGIELKYSSDTTKWNAPAPVNINNCGIKNIEIYPSPFVTSTTIRIEIPSPSFLNVSVYNHNGQLLTVLRNETVAIGTCTTEWNGTTSNGIELPKGMYLITIEANNTITSRKVIKL